MKGGPKTIEWLSVAVLVVVAVTMFFMWSAAQVSARPETAVQMLGATTDLMVFAALLVAVVILLRIYGKLDEIAKKR